MTDGGIASGDDEDKGKLDERERVQAPTFQPQSGGKLVKRNGVRSLLIKGPCKKSAHVRFPASATLDSHIYTEELVVSTPSQRNWRGILIALLVIMAVLGLIVFSIVLVSPPEEGPRVKGQRPTLEQILGPELRPRRFNGTWISNTEFVYRDVHGGISVFSAENLTSRTLMTNATFRQLNAVDFRLSGADMRYVLLLSDVTSVYDGGHATLARYHVVEVGTRLKFPLSWREDDDSAPLLQYATWSPDGTAIAFVHDNDVYYKPRVNVSLVCRITSSGQPGVLFNGVPDWLYENEVLQSGHALWFSPDGKYLMYVTFNDTDVGELSYPWYGGVTAIMSASVSGLGGKVSVGGTTRSVRRPAVGTVNPVVTVWVVNLKRPKYLFPVEVRPPSASTVTSDGYVTWAGWYGDHQAAVVWLNRRQNVSVIATCRPPTFICTGLHVERAESGWTEPIMHPVFSRHGVQCLARLPVQDGDRGHYMHACLVQPGNVAPLTHGPFELTHILAWDEDAHVIYAMATSESDPGARHMYRVGDGNSSVAWQCMTCAEIADMGNGTRATVDSPCNYSIVWLSPGYQYYVQECLGPDPPAVHLIEMATNRRLALLDDSAAIRSRLTEMAVPQTRRLSVGIQDNSLRVKYHAQVRLFYPPGLREHEDTTFPLVLVVDARPGSQAVSDRWEVSWPWYLASNRSFIVAQIDAGGGGYQGETVRRQLLNGLGTVEVTDQLAVLRYLVDEFKFIDRSRVCAIGWGYGGYVAAMMLALDSLAVINCSVSVSPISSWLFHDTYFTERYMGVRPVEQLLAYERADLTKMAGNLAGRHFMLVHGTADTTVGPQHAMLLARALIDQGVLFRQLVYPDEGYEFMGSRPHLYKVIDEFFDESFGPVSIDEWESDGGLFIQ